MIRPVRTQIVDDMRQGFFGKLRVGLGRYVVPEAVEHARVSWLPHVEEFGKFQDGDGRPNGGSV